MKFPLIVIPERKRDMPFLVSDLSADCFKNPMLLSQRGRSYRRAQLVSVDGVYQISSVTSPRNKSFLNLLLHGNKADYWDLHLTISLVSQPNVSAVVSMLENSMRSQPYDIWMQYHDEDVILSLLKKCESIAEIITVGCIVGAWEADDERFQLPQVHDNSEEYDPEIQTEMEYISSLDYDGKLSRQSIINITSKIKYVTIDDILNQQPELKAKIDIIDNNVVFP